MPPFNHFTTKAKEAIRKAHELAIERGQNHVNPMHLLAALMIQEESMVTSILEKLDIDTILLTDSIYEAIENPEAGATLSPSYQIFLTPELAQSFDSAGKIAANLQDEFVSTEHLFVAILDGQSQARELLSRFKISKEKVLKVLEELRQGKTSEASASKKPKSILKYTRSLKIGRAHV